MGISLATVGGKITAALFNNVAKAAQSQAQTLIVPGSIQGTGATLTPLGTLQLTNCSSFIADGIFTSAYDAYAIALDVTLGAAGNVSWTLRKSGTTDTTAGDYQVEFVQGAGTTASAGTNVTNQNTGGVCSDTITELSTVLELFRPALAVPTRALARSVGYNSTGPAIYSELYASRHVLSASYDGINFGGPSAGMTGTCRIYGLNNG